MRSQNRLAPLALVLGALTVLVAASPASAGWSAVTKHKWAGKKYIARTHAGCWYGTLPVLLCANSQSQWGGNVVSHCGPKYCIPGHAEAHAYNGPSGSGGWSSKKWMGFAGLGGEAEDRGAHSRSAAEFEVLVDDASGAVIVRLLGGGLEWTDGATSDVEVLIGYAPSDEEPPPAGVEPPMSESHEPSPAERVSETLWSGHLRVRDGRLEVIGDFSTLQFAERDGTTDDGLAMRTVDLRGVEIATDFDPARSDDLVVIVRGDSGAGDVPAVVAPVFRRGDSNGDGRVDLADPIQIVNELFQGRSPTTCVAASDSNGDGRRDLSDAIFLLQWSFSGGQEPPAPGPSVCGVDVATTLPCASYGGCD